MKFYFIITISFFISILSQISLGDGDVFSCTACVIGISSVISSVQNNPKTLTELGSQMSESCDSLPSKQDRLGCREIFSNHMNELFNAFVEQPEVSPESLCKQINYC
ncbi:Saposin B domain and Saposin-like domain-containing protein [Strongyloides ratti]|uniref:Saposin B domain and Saposin-like domain-containing protein n=1 Tax=Strongyloides ratti TaxID=34506 RepID=A0A090L6H2_STRRB|nr:Saposin B domain and Saposin-like domain-containing protein [Strongyloides ratti]CEF63104.1 Saposin B domain and Saposin-like domain-containing protein [Strongyloides ratti]